MRASGTALFVATAVALAGCGGDPTAPTDGQLENVRLACTAQLNVEPAVCSCLAERAEDDLTRDQVDVVIAAMMEKHALAMEERQQLTAEETAQVGLFMATAAAGCMTDAG